MEFTIRTWFTYQVILAVEVYPKFAFIQFGRRCIHLWRDYPPGCLRLGLRMEEWNRRKA